VPEGGTDGSSAVYRERRNTYQVQTMPRRSPLALLLATVASLMFATMAAAGGWAIATLDRAVPPPAVGQAFEVAFTLLQHGKTPVNSGSVVVEATGAGGAALSFPARRASGQGHWNATVILPTEGAWQWRIDMPNQLEVTSDDFGTLAVSAAPSVAADTLLLPVGLAVGAALLVTLLVWRLRPLRSARRSAAGEPQRS